MEECLIINTYQSSFKRERKKKEKRRGEGWEKRGVWCGGVIGVFCLWKRREEGGVVTW